LLKSKMSETEHNLIMAAIEIVRDTNNEAHDDIKELLSAGMRASRIQADTEMSIVNNRIDQITKKMDIQNGQVKALQIESGNRQQAFNDFRELQKVIKKYRKNWVFILLGTILFVVIVIFLYDTGLITYEWIINKLL